MKTQCNSDDSHLIYVGRIVGTDTLRPSVMVDLLEEWSRESASVVSAATTQLNIDQDCPIYLSSPSDPNCVQTGVTTDPPTTAPVVSNPPPTEDTSDENTNHVPIYTACIVGGFFIGCCLTLLIVVVVFFCRIKTKKKEIEEYVDTHFICHFHCYFCFYFCFVGMLFMLDLVEETNGLKFPLRIV